MSEKLVEANSTKCEAQVRETRGCLIPNAQCNAKCMSIINRIYIYIRGALYSSSVTHLQVPKPPYQIKAYRAAC